MANLAYDRIPLSEQYTDQDGRVHYTAATISKAVISPYLGREIPGYRELGLDPNKVYKLLRDPAELARGAATFNGLPLLDDHIHVSADSPKKDRVVGTIGTRAEFTDPDLKNDITVWDSGAIERIKNRKQRELSCSYYYDPVMEPGEYDGEAYDGRMTNIRGNHVALVSEGRVGPDAALDAALSKGNRMAYKRNAAQMLRHLNSAIASGKIAADASPEDLKKCMDEDPDVDPAEDDEEEEAKRKEEAEKAAKDKAARDAEEEEAKKKADEEEKASDARMKAAVDAAIVAERKRNADANDARSLVRPLVGEVVGLDSAEAILSYALKQKGVAHDGVNVPGLKALVQAQISSPVAVRPRIANDSSDTVKRFGPAPRKL